jgi:S-formylglutathione hydrolase FrmB
MLTTRSRIAILVLAAAFIGLGVAKAILGRGVRGYTHTYGASVVHYTLTSELLRKRAAEVAIVPPGNRRRPLLVLLHGRHDTGPLAGFLPQQTGPETLLSNELLAALVALGPRAPVVVLLNGGGHSYYHDRRDGPWGSMILQEAIPDAQRRFGTLPGRVAIGGISMGGFGALHLAAVAPGRFCAVAVRSAALWTSAAATPAGAFDDAADYARTDVFTAERAGRYDRLPVWLDVGSDDPFRTADADFARTARGRGDQVTLHVWPGGHDKAYWRAHWAAYLGFVAGALARCRS